MSEHDGPQVDPVDSVSPNTRGTIERLAYSPREAAAALGVTPNTIYNLIHRGELPAHKAGRRTLIAVADVRRLVGLGTS